MKHLFSLFAVLSLVLSGCASIIPSTSESAPVGNSSAETMQESAPADTNTSTQGSEDSVEIVGGNEESLKEFITHWLLPTYPDGLSQDITAYIGSLPTDMPYELPAPEESRIIGSITGTWVDYMLIFDSSLTAKAIHDFYAQTLIEKGWHEAPTSPGQGGFVAQSDLYKGYCYGEGEAFLNVENPPISDTKTSIRLSLDISPDSHMCDATMNSGYPYETLIPQLKAPSGAMIQGSGGGGSDRDAESTATLQTDLSPAELVEFYNQQLLSTGWEMQNSGSGEGAAWSNWSFKDDREKDWIGALMVVKASPDSNTLFALLRIEKAK